MIAKAPASTIPVADKPRRKKPREPLDVRLTFKINFGESPKDAVTVMQDRRLPMVNSVFEHRDRIVRTFAMSLVRVGLAQPKVMSEVFPAMKLLRKLKKAIT